MLYTLLLAEEITKDLCMYMWLLYPTVDNVSKSTFVYTMHVCMYSTCVHKLHSFLGMYVRTYVYVRHVCTTMSVL